MSVLAPGSLLGPYEIEAPLGAGGMAKVFRALDTRLNRTVAIKFPKRHFTEGFKREARASSRTQSSQHRSDLGVRSANGDEYFVMEFVPGCTLAELIREKRLSINEALVCSHRITSALAAAHAAGIVHRDIKPGNIIVSGDFTVVKILDFGLAKSEVKTRKPRSGSHDKAGTRVGFVRNREISPRSHPGCSRYIHRELAAS